MGSRRKLRSLMLMRDPPNEFFRYRGSQQGKYFILDASSANVLYSNNQPHKQKQCHLCRILDNMVTYVAVPVNFVLSIIAARLKT